MVDGLARSLTRRDSLYAERVAWRPHHFVFGLTVRASRQPLNLFSQPGGSNHPHSALAFVAAKNLLHFPSLPDLAGLEGPLLTLYAVMF